MGGTMRLGADPVKLHAGTRAREVYDEPVIYERHRHRYEVNNLLRRRLEDAGLVCGGTSPDDRLVELIELPDHPFFMASQYHPEFKSRPNRPAPLFRGFVGAALERARARTPRPSRARQTARCGPGSPAGPRATPRLRRALWTRPRCGARHRFRAGPARRAVRPAVRDPEPDGRRGRDGGRGAGGARVHAACGRGGRHGRRDRGRRGEPAGADPGRPGAPHDARLRPHRHRAPDRADRGRPLDGLFRNRNDAILGPTTRRPSPSSSQAARRWSARRPPVGMELLFTTSEETGLRGAKAFDRRPAHGGLRLRLRPRQPDRRPGRGGPDPLRA